MSALEQGYNADFDERGRVIVERECEECGKTFWVPVGRREQSFCGHECVAKNIAGSGVEASLETKKSEAQKKREAQLEVFAELEFELGREPKLSEWKERCAEKGIPKRLRTKYGFDDFADLKKNAMAYNHKVNSVEEVEGRHTVYNITVDDHHTVATVTKEYDNKHGNPNFNGVFAYQCGEIGMPPNDTCRLIAPNLFSAVRNPFEGNAEIDFDYLYRMYYEGQRLSDDLVTLEIEYMQRVLQKINEDDEAERYKRTERNIWRDLIESARKYRRTGLGFTALGDTLAAMGVRYGSEEAERMTNLIMRTKIKGEWDASIDMAIERGPFPEWRPEHDDTEFFDMLEEEFPTLYERNMEHGRRNISLSTVAPTGSVSLLAKIGDSYGTSSGIEPVFTTEPLKLWHTRRRRTNPGEEPDYVDENDNEWIEYTVFHSGVKEWAKAQDIDLTSHGYNEESGLVEDEEAMKDLLAESPYNGATSSELDAKDRIDLQAVVQKYTTHSISSTLNLPNDCPEDRVREIYEYAHEAGLKGVTVFRDGSKSGVLADSGGSSGFDYHDAPERPERLECKIHKLRRNGDNWKIFVGMYEDKPYEVFACKASMRLVDSDNHAFDKGYIDKHGEGVYSLVAPDEKVVLEDIAARMPSPEIEALTRMISMALRHGAKMDWIVEQLDKAEGSVASFSKALSTVLMEHMEEPVTCSECGSEDVSFQEGCLTCRSCGASKCG
jgi:ribonucleoside-diphosphate reductase alpha chain